MTSCWYAALFQHVIIITDNYVQAQWCWCVCDQAIIHREHVCRSADSGLDPVHDPAQHLKSRCPNRQTHSTFGIFSSDTSSNHYSAKNDHLSFLYWTLKSLFSTHERTGDPALSTHGVHTDARSSKWALSLCLIPDTVHVMTKIWKNLICAE